MADLVIAHMVFSTTTISLGYFTITKRLPIFEFSLRYMTFYVYCVSLRPSTRNVLSLAAEVKTLQGDKEHLRINLTRAEVEVRSKRTISMRALNFMFPEQ